MNPILCTNCGKKIGEVRMTEGIVSLKCKCGTINTVQSNNIPKQIERPKRTVEFQKRLV